MGFIDSLKRPFTTDDLVEAYELAEVSAPTVTIGGVTYNLLDWNPGHAEIDALPALKRGRGMTADNVKRLPVAVHREGVLVTSPRLVEKPDPSQSRSDFVGETVLSMIDDGNAYWRLYRNHRNQVDSAVVTDPARIGVTWDRFKRRTYTLDGNPIAVPRDLLVIPKDRGVNDLKGSGPLQSSRLQGLVTMLRYAETYFAEANDPSGVLTDPWDSTEAEVDEMRERWNAQPTRGTRVASGGLSWDKTAATPGEAEWVSSHAAGYVDVAVLLGIPPPLLGAAILGGSSSIVYQNLTTAYLQWDRDTLTPTFISPIAEAWSSILPGRQTVSIDTDALTRPELGDRVSIAAEAKAAGIFTDDEARAMVGVADAANAPTSAPIVEVPQ